MSKFEADHDEALVRCTKRCTHLESFLEDFLLTASKAGFAVGSPAWFSRTSRSTPGSLELRRIQRDEPEIQAGSRLKIVGLTI